MAPYTGIAGGKLKLSPPTPPGLERDICEKQEIEFKGIPQILGIAALTNFYMQIREY
jgi:hypothetical protein